MDALFNKVGDVLGGNFASSCDLNQLSAEARELLIKAWEGVENLYDYHAHLGGIGVGGTGCTVHELMFQPLIHPVYRMKYFIFMKGAGVHKDATADRDYLERIIDLVKAMRSGVGEHRFPFGRIFILALDHWYDEDGTVRKDKTGLFTPTEYVMAAAKEFPDVFIPVASVHPYRKDALECLDKYADAGIRLVKWLPNSQGMDPSHKLCIPFYEKMKARGMVLLCHVGHENSVDAGVTRHDWGNPLLIRTPLDLGLKVIAAHCASEGTNKDLDDPKLPVKTNFELFLRVFDDPKYKDLLYADISSMTAFKRIGTPLTTMLDREDLHHRLVFGTDYPVPAINIVVHTKAMVKQGYINEAEKKLINEIYHIHPMVFDLVLKRTLKSPKTGKKFAASVFNWNHNVLPAEYMNWNPEANGNHLQPEQQAAMNVPLLQEVEEREKEKEHRSGPERFQVDDDEMKSEKKQNDDSGEKGKEKVSGDSEAEMIQ